MTDSLGRRLVLFLALLVCASFSMAMFAQSTIDGSIGGTVTDQSKAVVPNAKVSVVNLGTNREVTTTSDAMGKFRVTGLRPGTYAVTATAPSFGTYKATVIVEVGLVTNVEATLPVAGKGETVEVTGEAPVINTSSHDFNANINETVINNIPMNGRRWSMYVLMTPGAVPDGGFGLVSFRGISGLLNNNTVDGGDNNQAFFSEERGRTRASYTVSQNSVQEFQVNTSNYSAEYGRAAGGVVNSVTKSGTNTLHGQVFFFDRDATFGATNPFSKIYVKDTTGAIVPEPFKPEDKRYQFGGNVGGAIIKDKLFFFFNYDGQRRNFPGMAIAGTSFFNPVTTSEVNALIKGLNLGTGTCTPWPACAQDPALPTYQGTQATAAFNEGINFLLAETGPVPRRGDQDIFFPKLDYRINDQHTLTASFNRMRWNSPAGVQTQPTNTYGTNSFGNDGVKVDMLNVRLTSMLSSTATNELRYQWGRDFEFQTSQMPSAAEITYGLDTAPDGRVPGISIGGGGPYLGRPNFLERAAYPDERRHQVADNVTIASGKHLLKFGIDWDRTEDRYSNLYQGGGQYSYNNRVDFITDLLNFKAGTPTKNYSNYYQAFGPLGMTFHTIDMAGFIQDEIRVLPRLTMNLGLRYEYELLPRAIMVNANLPQTSFMPSDKNNFGPRFGFAYDLFGNGKTSIRGGWGLYYGRINNGAIGGALLQTGASNAQSSYTFCKTQTSTCAAGPAFPALVANAGVAGKASASFFSPTLQNPQIHQADLIVEQQVAKNTVVSATYLMSLGRELPSFYDTNLAPPSMNPTTMPQSITWTVAGGPFNGKSFTVPFYGTRLNSSYNGIYEMLSNVNSSYNALVLQFNRRMTNGLQFTTNYTYSHAIDQNQNTSTMFQSASQLFDPYNRALEKGNSGFDIRHRVVASVVWQPHPFRTTGGVAKAIMDGWSLAPVVTWSTGKPYTEYISGNAYNGASSLFGANGKINGAGGNDSRLEPLVGRNFWRYPNFRNIDMRLSREIKVKERHSVEFIAEAFNLFNSQIITGVNNTLYKTNPGTTAGAGTTPGTATLTYANDVAGYSPFGSASQAGTNMYRERQVQFAVKYNF